MHSSSSVSCPSALVIGGRPVEGTRSEWVGGDIGSLAIIAYEVPPTRPSFPPGKGKGKINEIRHPNGSKYLKDALR